MSKKRRVIDYKNIPAKFPFTSTLSLMIALDYWKAPGWLCGAVYAILILVWITTIIEMGLQQRKDIFNDD